MNENNGKRIVNYLQESNESYAPVLDIPFTNENLQIIDLSKDNTTFRDVDINDYEGFTDMLFQQIKKNGAKVGVGGYLEDRFIYNQSENFNGVERRTIHLGIDLWVVPETVVYTPLDGVVHSFKNNSGFGNYGPTIILEHQTPEFSFYTLYGHLTLDSLKILKEGDVVKTGDFLGRIGSASENGGWPPHLHFQIITDLEGNYGDFPGVSAPSAISKYSSLCPNPNLILKIDKLN